MNGVSFQVTTSGMEAALSRLNRLSSLDKHELMDGLGRLGQMQTRRRLEVEKTSPGGAEWKKTTDGRAALFVGGTHLSRSIDYISGETEARWGSGWIGARIHQFGGVIVPVNAKCLAFKIGAQTLFRKKVTIPARPYVGMSEANKTDMVLTAWEFIDKVLH